VNPVSTNLEFSVNINSELVDNSFTTFDFLIDCEVNVLDVYTKNDFIFPNPASNYLNMNLKGEKYIEISDLSGRLVMSLSTFDNIIDISLLKEGLYFVSVKSHQLSQKLIVR